MIAIVDTTENIREFLCGAQQHNEHCKGYRWHLYCRDDEQRYENVKAELARLRDLRRAREAMLEAAE